ncbi:sensor histidine kinase [Polaribacter porphyrae]|uniref:histidine kinase n=1 Tax=Polaribacter porphyrae TaxID=1137780 RepID=A0A2S7WJR9_9FLAO|nr:ATP-binding protein [Polaribacter porphyrae]PQJ77844.1 PAS domain-containing sensor histidine kinase [Polaribacter porphyrae]
MREEIEVLQRALERERFARKSAEKILEEKSRNLFTISRELKLTNLHLQQLLDEKSSVLEGIFENINDAYLVIDLQGNILKMNDIAENLFGYNLNEEQLNFTDLIYESDKEYTKNSFITLKEKGSLSNYTIRIVTKSNKIKWIQINASLLFDRNKKPKEAQGIVRDITAIKELELQKEKILHQLEKSNEELKEYAHIVSHDLKSPLRSINALISWIKHDNLDKFDENSLKNFELIEDTLSTMDNLISDILEYSSADADSSNQTKVDLNHLVLELKKVLYIPNHIAINIKNKLPNLVGDKIKFQQLFQNLISNSVKFIDKEKGIIDIDVQDKNTYYQFSVADNGIGIEEKYHKKIFKIFQTLNKNKESTGIGLSIVKKIVNLYQGDIWLESYPQKGTKFIFTLKK